MSPLTGAAALFRVRDVEPATGGCGSFTCEFAGIVTDPSVVAVVFIGMGALVALASVRTAKEACRRERRRVLNERDAFEEFAERVEALDPVAAEPPTAVAAGSPARLHQTIGSGNATESTL